MQIFHMTPSKQNLDGGSAANPSMAEQLFMSALLWKPWNGTTAFQGLHLRTPNMGEDLSTAGTWDTKHTRWRWATAWLMDQVDIPRGKTQNESNEINSYDGGLENLVWTKQMTVPQSGDWIASTSDQNHIWEQGVDYVQRQRYYENIPIYHMRGCLVLLFSFLFSFFSVLSLSYFVTL